MNNGVNSEEFTEQERNYHGIECPFYPSMHEAETQLSTSSFPWDGSIERVFPLTIPTHDHLSYSLFILNGAKSLKFFILPSPTKIEERTVFDNNIILSFASSIFHILADPLIRLSSWKSHIFLFFEILYPVFIVVYSLPPTNNLQAFFFRFYN